VNLQLKNSANQDLQRALKLWTALAFAPVPILIAACSKYIDGVPYFEMGNLLVRSLQFIEWSIFTIGLYVFVRWFRKVDLLKCLAWILIFLVSVIFGIGYVEFLKSSGGPRSYLFIAGVVLTDFGSAMSFGITYRLAQRMLNKR
jgi:hypothetical protein